MAKKDLKESIEIIESPEALREEVTKFEKTIEKNSKTIYIIAGIAVIGLAAFFGNKYYQNSQAEEGEKKLFSAVYAFESDSLNTANQELLAISDEFGGSTQNLADFYLGVSYMKQGRFNDAIEKLKNFESGDLLVQARAYALIGDCYMETKAYSEAIPYLVKASEYKPNDTFTPGYLLKLAIAYEANEDNQEAIETYSKIIDNYPIAPEAMAAKKYKGMLESASDVISE